MAGRVVSFGGRVAGLAVIFALHAYWFLQPIPTGFKTLAAAFVVLSLLRPAWGLIAFAAIAPLSTALATQLGGAGMGAQLLEQLALALAAGVLLQRSPGTPTRIGAPALAVAAITVASAAVIVVQAVWLPIPDGRPPVVFAQFWDRRVAQASPIWTPALVAITAIACACLAWAAERTVRQKPQLVSILVMTGLAAHAATALLNLNAIWEQAQRSADFWPAFATHLGIERISIQMPTDVHAAASAFLLAGVAGVGLLKGPWKRRAGLAMMLLLIVAGLWTTGSRVAILFGGLSALTAMFWWAARRSRRHLIVTTVAMGVIAAAVWFALFAPSRYNPTAYSFNARVVMMKAGMQMFASAPAFGIGVTRFYSESAAVVGPEIQELVSYPRENAHNNFIQVLAEQGVVGLAAMVWWLAAMIGSGARAQAAKPDVQRGALLLAIVACVGTWFMSHPLLVPEFALVFWMYGGVLVAMTPNPAPTRWRWLGWALIAALVLSVPPRAVARRNAADLEHRGLGVSIWHHDDTQRYREAGAAFSLYLPVDRAPVVLPIRRAPSSSSPIVIDVSMAGRHLTTITLEDDAWHDAAIAVPQSSRRFDLVDFSVRQPACQRREIERPGADRPHHGSLDQSAAYGRAACARSRRTTPIQRAAARTPISTAPATDATCASCATV